MAVVMTNYFTFVYCLFISFRCPLQSSIPKCTQKQLSSFITRLSSTTGVDMRRIVNAQCTITSDSVPKVQLIVRPPFRSTQMQNSYVSFVAQRTHAVFTSIHTAHKSVSELHHLWPISPGRWWGFYFHC